jgi:hypothetical protein
MPPSPAVDLFVAALRDPSDDARAAARAQLAADVETFGPFGSGSGPAAVDAVLEHPRILMFVAHADWSAPALDDGLITVTAKAPPTAPVGGFRFRFGLDADGRIARIEQDLLPAAPPVATPLALTDAQVELLAEGLANGTPTIVAYVDADGRPRLSYRATVQAVGRDRLGMWIRDPHGGLVRALPGNPHLSCFYGDRAHGITLQFQGRGRVETDPALVDQIYDRSPKPERDMDWRRGGVAVVVDLDRVEGRDASGRVLMSDGTDGS